DLGDGQARGVGGEDALRLADLIERAEGFLLDLHLLKRSFDGEVAVGAEVFLDARGDRGEDRVNLLLGHFALGDELRVALGDLVLAAFGPFLLDVAQRDGKAFALGKRLGNALAHRASADNTDFHGIYLLDVCLKLYMMMKEACFLAVPAISCW